MFESELFDTPKNNYYVFEKNKRQERNDFFENSLFSFTENIDEIKRGLEEGVFQRVTARELSHLIAAAFAESEKRTALLNALAHF